MAPIPLSNSKATSICLGVLDSSIAQSNSMGSSSPTSSRTRSSVMRSRAPLPPYCSSPSAMKETNSHSPVRKSLNFCARAEDVIPALNKATTPMNISSCLKALLLNPTVAPLVDDRTFLIPGQSTISFDHADTTKAHRHATCGLVDLKILVSPPSRAESTGRRSPGAASKCTACSCWCVSRVPRRAATRAGSWAAVR